MFVTTGDWLAVRKQVFGGREASKMAETQYKPPGLEPWDIVIVVLYFVIILGVGLYVSISLYV